MLESDQSPHDRSPRYTPRSRSPSRRSSYDRERSPRGHRSPRSRASAGGGSGWGSPSPRRSSRSRSPWDRSSPRERSRSPMRGGSKRNWGGGRGFRGGRGKQDRFFRQNRPRIDYSGRDQQDFPPDKSDPRPTLVYSDLEKVPGENFDIDYENVLALFKKSSKV